MAFALGELAHQHCHHFASGAMRKTAVDQTDYVHNCFIDKFSVLNVFCVLIKAMDGFPQRLKLDYS
jgi:hypothetical protein